MHRTGGRGEGAPRALQGKKSWDDHGGEKEVTKSRSPFEEITPAARKKSSPKGGGAGAAATDRGCNYQAASARRRNVWRRAK